LLKPMTKHLLLWLLEHLGRLGEFQEDVITQRNRDALLNKCHTMHAEAMMFKNCS